MINREVIESICCTWHVYRFPLVSVTLIVLLAACAQEPINPHQGVEPPSVSGGQPIEVRPIALRPDHPKSYRVVRGDTLWGIAGHFLMDPWRWPEVWRQNPQITNPNLIFPGDVIELYYEDGQPRLRVGSRRTGSRPTVRLSPKIRTESLVQPIATLPREAIEQFLRRSMVLTFEQWSVAPHLIGASDNALVFGAYSKVYARGANFDQRLYQVFRPEKEYFDPVTGESLGFNLTFVGEAVLEEEGDPATLQLTTIALEGRSGDRLFAVEDEGEEIYRFMPHPVPQDTEGQILAALNDGGYLIGQYQTVVLNLGEWDGIEPGHVMAIYNPGRIVDDTLASERVRLPDLRAGLLMVYRVFDRTSFGLITETTRAVKPLARVTTP